MMKVHLPGVVLHLEGDRRLEEVLLLGEDLHLGEMLEKGMEEGHGGLVLLEMTLPEVEIEIVAHLEGVEETLERGEVLLPGVCLQEEDLLPEETLAEMMTVEVVLLLAVHLLKVELGAAEVATGLLLGEVLHPGVEVPLPAEEVVTMAQLTGAVTA